jgi:acetyl esterase/lipase
MITEKKKVWGGKRSATYTKYLLSNSVEIDSGHRYPAVIICAGGGFFRITEREQQPVAMFFLSQGFHVFVLNYITKSDGIAYYPEPVMDLAKLLIIIRDNAQAWNVNPEQIAVVGFSAGGQICASLSTQWNSAELIKQLEVSECPKKIRPDAVVLCYPLLDYLYQRKRMTEDESGNCFSHSIGMKKQDFMQIFFEAGVGINPTEEDFRKASPYYHINNETPPTFIWHTAADELIYAEQSLRYARKLGENHIPYEIHIFEEGAHGLSMATDSSASNTELINPDVAIWPGLAVKFLKRHL